jgi:hypothetical protein
VVVKLNEKEWEEENAAENKKSSNEPCFNDLQMLFNASNFSRIIKRANQHLKRHGHLLLQLSQMKM